MKRTGNGRSSMAFEEYRRRVIERFDEEAKNAKRYSTLTTGTGETYVIDGCDGFCPECKLITKCDTYEEMKEGWRLFYS